MDVRFGKIKATGETYQNPHKQNFESFESSEENFFNAFQHRQNNSENQQPQKNNVVPLRLNDLDSNILENKAYNDMPDKILKLEHKISNIENAVNKITRDIQTLENLGYDIQLYDLKDKRSKLEEELARLKQEYSEQDLSAKFSNGIASALNLAGKHTNFIDNFKHLFANKVLVKVSKNFKYAQTMKEALENLSNINDSVDELIKMQVPYGENLARYKKLTAYLNKANCIHAEIAGKMHKISK